MPSFDVVSEIDDHELDNAIDQANREVKNRFDFKCSEAKYEQVETHITLSAETDFQLKQMSDILHNKFVKRGLDAQALTYEDPEIAHKHAKQVVRIQKGINKEKAKQIVKIVKDSKLKVQASIQGEQVRITGKKRDDLQDAINLLKEQKLGLALQYVNFRD